MYLCIIYISICLSFPLYVKLINPPWSIKQGFTMQWKVCCIGKTIFYIST